MRRHPRTSSHLIATLLLTAMTASSVSQAAPVLGYEGPLVPAANGSWKEFRTSEEKDLLEVNPDDVACTKKLPANLRELLFEHFRYYADHSKSKITETEIARFAKVAGMAPHESSGAAAAVSDMKYAGSLSTIRHFRNDNKGDGRPGMHSSLASIDKLMAMTSAPVVKCSGKGKKRKCVETMKKVTWDSQTNFGLLQMSADRLGRSDTGQLARDMLTDLKELYVSHPDEVIDRCGTKIMYKDSESDIRNAFRKLQACTPGMNSKAAVQCFGRWATLCPNYNIALALIATPAYFATRKAAPLCAKTFRRILKTGRSGPATTTPEKKVVDTKTTAPTPSFIERVKSIGWNPFAATTVGLPDPDAASAEMSDGNAFANAGNEMSAESGDASGDFAVQSESFIEDEDLVPAASEDAVDSDIDYSRNIVDASVLDE